MAPGSGRIFEKRGRKALSCFGGEGAGLWKEGGCGLPWETSSPDTSGRSGSAAARTRPRALHWLRPLGLQAELGGTARGIPRGGAAGQVVPPAPSGPLAAQEPGPEEAAAEPAASGRPPVKSHCVSGAARASPAGCAREG